MNGQIFRKLFLCCFLFICHYASGQYILNGTAKKVSCNCYTLTDETQWQGGSVWNSNKINLQNSFDFWFNVYLGCLDANGADGIVFILQPVSTSIGSSGEGMGFGGVQPSIGIALDTWQNFNLNDPFNDHISIQANGNINHANDLAGPVAISATAGNVEDCKWHVLRVAWDAAGKTLSVYFDGNLRLEKQVDLVATIFNNDPNVFWGFAGATGGSVNLQQFCTALNPKFTVNAAQNGGCVDKPVQFNDASESFAPIMRFNWSFGDGTFSQAKDPPPHTYPAPGEYEVKLTIQGQDGCEKDSATKITIGSAPDAGLTAFDTCLGQVPRFQLSNNNTGVSYQWLLDDVPFSTSPQPLLPPVNEGQHKLEVIVTSDFNCGPPAREASLFTIKPLPKVETLVENGCVLETLHFSGVQIDNATTVSQWLWNFGDGTNASSQQVTHRYNAAGQYNVGLWALATNGCSSDTVQQPVAVNSAIVFAGKDTAVVLGVPFQLQGSGNGDLLWSPAAGLSNPSIANPEVTLFNDRQFVLTVTTLEGCMAKDTVFIKAYKGPAIYVPSAFTPNGDGKNDRFKPVYVGYREIKEFVVYNRWGHQVFRTNNMSHGWDGRGASPDTYVWLVQAVDAAGKVVVEKGTVTVIR